MGRGRHGRRHHRFRHNRAEDQFQVIWLNLRKPKTLSFLPLHGECWCLRLTWNKQREREVHDQILCQSVNLRFRYLFSLLIYLMRKQPMLTIIRTESGESEGQWIVKFSRVGHDPNKVTQSSRPLRLRGKGSLSLPRTKQTGGHIISLDTPSSWPLGCLSGHGHNNTNNKDRKINTGTGTFKGTNRDCTENSQREDTQSK